MSRMNHRAKSAGIRPWMKPAKTAAAGFLLLTAACGGGGSSASSAALKIIHAATDVRLQAAGNFVSGQGGESLTAGNTVRTDLAGFAELDYPDGSLTRLSGSTTFTLTKLVNSAGTRQVGVKLDAGKTWNRVQKVTASGGFSVSTPNAVATVEGTTFALTCLLDGTCTFVLIEGTLKIVTSSGQTITLTSGQKLTVGPDGTPGQPTVLTTEDLSDPWITTNQALDAGQLPPSGSTPTSPTVPGGALSLTGGQVTMSFKISRPDGSGASCGGLGPGANTCSFTLLPDSTYAPPPGAMRLDYSQIVLQGPSFVGSRKTSRDLTWTFPHGGCSPAPCSVSVFVSKKGECTITITKADATGIAGSFRCSDMQSSSGQKATLNSTGSFTAST